MSTPLVLLTGVDADSMATAMISLQWDTQHAVAVRHVINVEKQILTRIVSDAAGIVERTHIELDHACVNCALREDIMPTLERLADSGRWASIVAHLPVAAEATQVCRILATDDVFAQKLHVAAVLTIIDGTRARADLLGDELLRECGLQTSADDNRGVAETNAALIEYADAVVVVGDISNVDRDLITVLSRPGVQVITDHASIDGEALVAGLRLHESAEAWVNPERGQNVGLLQRGEAWTMELRSDRPFHPDRLLNNIEGLGGGSRRSRGCFWLPTRPGSVCQWDGAGGQLSVGVCSHAESEPHTRILVTGIDDDRDQLRELFEHCLLSDEELATQGPFWETFEDGFEPWLGPVRLAA